MRLGIRQRIPSTIASIDCQTRDTGKRVFGGIPEFRCVNKILGISAKGSEYKLVRTLVYF